MQILDRSVRFLVYSGCAMVMIGATPVARVIGTEPVEVGGIAAPARNFVPVVVGDEVTTQAGTAVVQFRDGSNVVLQPNSQLRIEGKTARPLVHLTRGSAKYDLARNSTLRIVGNKGETIGEVLNSAVPGPVSITQPDSPLTGATMYRASATSRQSGFVAPTATFTTGSFVAGPISAAGTGSAQIIAPNGMVISLTATVNATTGATTYTVQSVQETFTNPTTGVTTTVTSTSGPLIGATVGIPTATQTGTSVSITLTTPGSTTPLTPTETVTAIQQTVQAGAPTGVTVPQPQPVVTGQFSGTGGD